MSGNLDPSKPCLTRSYQLQSPVLPESAYSLTRHRRVRSQTNLDRTKRQMIILFN